VDEELQLSAFFFADCCHFLEAAIGVYFEFLEIGLEGGNGGFEGLVLVIAFLDDFLELVDLVLFLRLVLAEYLDLPL
jgi:hypothetical protein